MLSLLLNQDLPGLFRWRLRPLLIFHSSRRPFEDLFARFRNRVESGRMCRQPQAPRGCNPRRGAAPHQSQSSDPDRIEPGMIHEALIGVLFRLMTSNHVASLNRWSLNDRRGVFPSGGSLFKTAVATDVEITATVMPNGGTSE